MKYELTVLIVTEAENAEEAIMNVLNELDKEESTANCMLLNIKEGEKQ